MNFNVKHVDVIVVVVVAVNFYAVFIAPADTFKCEQFMGTTFEKVVVVIVNAVVAAVAVVVVIFIFIVIFAAVIAAAGSRFRCQSSQTC